MDTDKTARGVKEQAGGWGQRQSRSYLGSGGSPTVGAGQVFDFGSCACSGYSYRTCLPPGTPHARSSLSHQRHHHHLLPHVDSFLAFPPLSPSHSLSLTHTRPPRSSRSKTNRQTDSGKASRQTASLPEALGSSHWWRRHARWDQRVMVLLSPENALPSWSLHHTAEPLTSPRGLSPPAPTTTKSHV